MGACAAGLVALAVAPATAQSSGEAPEATEIGVTPDEIHIAVIADVDNAFAPGLFKGARDGVVGAARYINSKAGGGGLAGRKLVVDFIDSHLNANDSRNAVITACQQDYAMVGNFMLFLSNVDDEVTCKDEAGAPTGLPDLASVTTGIPQSCSPVAFPVSPAAIDCATEHENPQIYRGNQFDSKYLLKTHHHDLHGAMIVSSDTKDANRGGTILVDTAQQAGIKADQDVTIGGRDPQSAYTPIVQKMKSDGSNYAYVTSAANSAILLRSEAQLQGLTDPDIVWACTIACYDKSVTKQADVMEGEYIPMTFLPFEEANTNPTLKAFLKYVGKNNADGMIGTVDIKNKVPTPCAMVVQLHDGKDGKFVRKAPKKKGTFDCRKSNEVTIQANLISSS